MAEIVLAKDIYEEIQKEREASGPRPKFNTGFQMFDDGKRFLRPGQYSVIAGASGSGKSTFARTLVHKLDENSVKSCFFSLEEEYEDFLEECPSLNFYMPKEVSKDRLSWVLEHALRARDEHGAEISFIDNFTHLGDPSDLKKLDSQNAAQRYGLMAQEIHDFCVKNKLTMFVLHHVNQEAGAAAFKQDSTKPLYGQHHLRETSQLANLANAVIFIQRMLDKNSKEETPYSLVYAAKWRSGGKLPRFTVSYDEATKQFKEDSAEKWFNNLQDKDDWS